MRIKTDENLPAEAAATLRECGLDAETVWDESLVTLDLDFANVRAYPPDRYPGIIVLRLKSQRGFATGCFFPLTWVAIWESSPRRLFSIL